MRYRVCSLGAVTVSILAVTVAVGCSPKKMMKAVSGEVLPAPAPDKPAVDLPGRPVPPPSEPEQVRPIPFDDALPPGDPPPPPAPPPRPLTAWDVAALDVLYERPSPMGPPPTPRDPAVAAYVVGKHPVIQVLPGPTVFADSVPPQVRVAMPPETPFSNNVAQLSRGEIRYVAFDRTVNDSKLSQDSLALDASFTDFEGNDWRIVVMRIAPLSPQVVTDPWAGGVVIDSLWHGQTFRGSSAEPLVNHAVAGWGWADVWKNGKKVKSSGLLHIMLTNDVRDDANGFRYACYDCRGNPAREIHILMPPQNNLPSPGGFLHVMWEDAEVVTGTPDEIAARAPWLGPNLPTLILNAVPHLQWSDTEIEVQAGQPVRVILNNFDPQSFHAFMVHTPEGTPHVPLPQGSQWVTSLVFDQPGEYEFWCPVGNHRMRGMYGRIIVTESVPGGTKGPPGGND